MAFDRQSSSNGSMSQINVTPLVDVMLVLLVIFMVTAPILQQGVNVELPRAELGALSAEEAPLVVSLTRGGTLYLNEEAISRQGLVARLRTTVDERGEKPVYIRADESLPYGEVVSVMAAIHEAGIRQVGMVTQLPPVGG